MVASKQTVKRKKLISQLPFGFLSFSTAMHLSEKGRKSIFSLFCKLKEKKGNLKTAEICFISSKFVKVCFFFLSSKVWNFQCIHQFCSLIPVQSFLRFKEQTLATLMLLACRKEDFSIFYVSKRKNKYLPVRIAFLRWNVVSCLTFWVWKFSRYFCFSLFHFEFVVLLMLEIFVNWVY